MNSTLEIRDYVNDADCDFKTILTVYHDKTFFLECRSV